MAGTVTIYLKATAKDLSYANARIGDNNVTAYDTDGNEYKTNDYATAKNLAVGVPVKFEPVKTRRRTGNGHDSISCSGRILPEQREKLAGRQPGIIHPG